MSSWNNLVRPFPPEGSQLSHVSSICGMTLTVDNWSLKALEFALLSFRECNMPYLFLSFLTWGMMHDAFRNGLGWEVFM